MTIMRRLLFPDQRYICPSPGNRTGIEKKRLPSHMKTFSIQRIFPNIDPNEFILETILDDFYEGVLITDTDGRILYCNDAQAKIDDLEPEDVLGKKVTDVYWVDDGISPAMQCVRSGNTIENLACFYRTRLGKIVNSIHNVFPLHAKGRLIGTICFVRDYSIVEQTFEAVSPPRKKGTMRTLPVDSASRKPRNLPNGTRFTFDHIIGRAPDFTQAVEAAKLSSDSPSPVMLFGETGAGKELFAQSIHNNSRRHLRHFVAVNCAAIPENLLEGILFGTSRGAFTGAIDKPGLFERADGGALLLDEINAMPVGLQAKLLRTLQERKVRRVGSLDEIEIDIKIISSVNEEPHQAIARGALRPDLHYRLGVVFIRIPPLRERMEDLDRLIRYFLRKANARLNKNVNAVSAEVMDLFRRYRWPGNVRELEHIIEGALNLAGDGHTIDSCALPGHIGALLHEKERPFSVPGSRGSSREETHSKGDKGRVHIVFPASQTQPDDASAPKKNLSELQTENEIRSIEAALTETGGNAAKAARRLGLSPQLLHYKLKKFNIDRKKFKRR